MNFLASARTLSLVATLSAASWAQAATVAAFSDNFQGNLSGWTDRTPADPESKIVADPLGSGSMVLSFNRTGVSGSLFSNDSVVSPDSWFTLSFDYLGIPGRGGIANDLGGYIGVAATSNVMGMQFWIGGTGAHVTPVDLIDDGKWHSYSYTFRSNITNSLRVIVEDWAGSRGVAGDVFFDNIVLRNSVVPTNAVPEPASLALVGLALAAVGVSRRRRAA
jgi:hypothetical protein